MFKQFAVRQLDEHTWQIEEQDYRLVVWSYLLEGEEKAALIDTGLGHIPMKAIVENLTDKPVFVINTHPHADHVGANADFDEIYMNPLDEAEYKRVQEGDCPYPCPRPVNPNTIPAVEGDRFDLGGRTLRIIETHAHTEGHISILDETYRKLYTGDVCFNGKTMAFQKSGLPGHVEVLSKMAGIADEFDELWPSHYGAPIEKEVFFDLLQFGKDILDGKCEIEEFIDAKFVGYKCARRGQLYFAFPPLDGPVLEKSVFK